MPSFVNFGSDRPIMRIKAPWSLVLGAAVTQLYPVVGFHHISCQQRCHVGDGLRLVPPPSCSSRQSCMRARDSPILYGMQLGKSQSRDKLRQGCLVSSTSQWDDVARPRRGSLMQSLWEACDKEAMSTVRHPLVVQLGLGTLPEAPLLAFVSVLGEVCGALGVVLADSVPSSPAALESIASAIPLPAQGSTAAAGMEDVLEGSRGAIDAVLSLIRREGEAEEGMRRLLVGGAILRLISTLGHTLECARDEGTGEGLHACVVGAMGGRAVDSCLADLEVAGDTLAQQGGGEQAIKEWEGRYRSTLALVYNLVDVLGYEAGLRGSSEVLREGRRQIGGAMSEAAARQAAAMAKAAAYKKAAQGKEGQGLA